jgi:superfamily II RNA helicase
MSYPADSTKFNTYFERYPYSLSAFQKHAIEGIVNNNHVLITAHTGSGKTLPAEFAIEHWVGQGKKVIYTSPIKALSNQKFYEFRMKFPHISFGLFTGDIKTNPEADVLIMTTEILMNRLFNKSLEKESAMDFQMDFETELAAVVFDEIHYINDAERGQVWEKTILMLPDHVQMVMLSATLDKPDLFAKWIEDSHKNKQVVLCPTTHRVVPLTHYGFTTMSEHDFKEIKDKSLQARMRKLTNKPILLKDSQGKFMIDGYNELKEVRNKTSGRAANRKFCLNQLSKYLLENDMLPAIGFVFSRKHVETCAKEMTTSLFEDDSKIPYTIQYEASQIIRKLPNHEEYTKLREYVELMSYLEKGVGIHHSGMIPVLREIVELFISKKYIKLLFATESFAIGLDCPIKTAIFTGLTKYDGHGERYLQSHEYTQMSGRAGRRGIDTFGNVIHCNSLFRNMPTLTEYKMMMEGKPPKLVSKFKIDYGLVFSVLKATTPDTFVKIDKIVSFVEKSMMFDELRAESAGQVIVVSKTESELVRLNTFVINVTTPDHVCLKYRELLSTIKSECQQKKRKKIQMELDNVKEEHRDIEKDILILEKIETQENLVRKEKAHLEHLRHFIQDQVLRICRFLENQGFLKTDNEAVATTETGLICSHVAELHGPIWITCMVNKWDYFRDFTPKQIVGILSCITDVKVKDDEQEEGTKNIKDPFMKTKVTELKEKYTMYGVEEEIRDIHTGIRYDDAFNCNIVEEAIAWCDCESEEACKLFIQEKLADKDISVGDFTKAMLKISTIAKELRGLYELPCCNTQTEWLHKLSQIEDLVLKYIATNQSLYV